MNVFPFKHRLSACFSTGPFSRFTLLCVLFFLSSCAPIGRYPSMTAGEPKNSLPFFDKDLVEELRIIAVPPFLGDQHSWHELAIEILSSSKRISVTPSGKMYAALKNSKRDFASLRPEERPAFIAGLGRAVQADGVMNGVIVDKEGRHEIILQIISAKDSRVIWWQAVDFSFRDGMLSRSGQKKVLYSLLSPFLNRAGIAETPAQLQSTQEPEPPSGLYPQAEEPPRAKTRPAIKPAPKLDKKHDKNRKPLQLPDDISPM